MYTQLCLFNKKKKKKKTFISKCSCLKVTKFTDVWSVMFLISFTFVCPMVPETADADLLSDISCYLVISGNSTALSPCPHPRPNTFWVRADPPGDKGCRHWREAVVDIFYCISLY